MRNVGLSLSFTLMFVVSSVPADAALITYTTRASFEAAAGSLVTETFEEGKIVNAGAQSCPSPMDSSTSNACFDAGDIVAGLQLIGSLSDPTNGFILTAPGFQGIDSKAIFTNSFSISEVLDLKFTAGTNAVGFDLYSLYDSSITDVYLYSSTGVLGSFAISAASSGPGTFFGVTSTEQIFQVTLVSRAGQPEGVDNVSFGSAATAVPEPASMFLLGTGLAGAGLRRWRQKRT